MNEIGMRDVLKQVTLDDIHKFSNYSDKESYYETLMNRNYTAFVRIPFEDRTKRLCDLYISLSWNAFRFPEIPEKYLTEELCLDSISHYPELIKYIPKKFMNENFYLSAVIRMDKFKCCLQYIPENYITRIMCEIAVNKQSHQLQYVPKKFKSSTLCFTAAKRDIHVLKYIEAGILSDEMYKELLDMNLNAFEYIPKHLLTDDLLLSLARKKGCILQYIKNQTPELCLEAVKNDCYALQYVKRKTKKLCMIAFKQDKNTIQLFPKKFLSEKLIMEAFKNNPSIVLAIPEEFVTEDMLIRLINQKPLILMKLNKRRITASMCTTALKCIESHGYRDSSTKYTRYELYRFVLELDSIKYSTEKDIQNLIKILKRLTVKHRLTINPVLLYDNIEQMIGYGSI